MSNLTNIKPKSFPFIKLAKTAFLALSFFISPLSSTHSQASPKIAICQVVEHPALGMNLKGILEGLKSRGYSEETGAEITIENAQGNTLLMSQISQRLASLDADVYVAIGTQAAQSLKSTLKNTGKPLVFSTITDPRGAKLVDNYETPEGFVTGVSNATELEPQFKLFKELVPNLRRLGVIYNPGEANSVTSLERMDKAADQLGIEIVAVAASKTSEVTGAAKSLIGQVDAFFVDNDNTALASFEGIVKIGLKNNIPAFVSDTDMVDRGALAALGPNQLELGKTAGEMAASLLDGVTPRDIPVHFPDNLEKIINRDIAEKLAIEGSSVS